MRNRGMTVPTMQASLPRFQSKPDPQEIRPFYPGLSEDSAIEGLPQTLVPCVIYILRFATSSVKNSKDRL
jgi:hypothetical protein